MTFTSKMLLAVIAASAMMLSEGFAPPLVSSVGHAVSSSCASAEQFWYGNGRATGWCRRRGVYRNYFLWTGLGCSGAGALPCVAGAGVSPDRFVPAWMVRSDQQLFFPALRQQLNLIAPRMDYNNLQRCGLTLCLTKIFPIFIDCHSYRTVAEPPPFNRSTSAWTSKDSPQKKS